MSDHNHITLIGCGTN